MKNLAKEYEDMNRFVSWMLALGLLLCFFKILILERHVDDVERNAAIAVLSAEFANNKVGAIAPVFRQDLGAFAKAWLGNEALPGAIFSTEILNDVRDHVARGATPAEIEELTQEFNQRSAQP